MYTVTFYSFKGGTGRSMALVNVAVDLANRGRTVLIVDFDLEAPGLDTFRLGDRSRSSLGVVDYVGRYITTGEPPRLDEYVYETHSVLGKKGRILVMTITLLLLIGKICMRTEMAFCFLKI
jgi:nitrogenase subunit NifH